MMRLTDYIQYHSADIVRTWRQQAKQTTPDEVLSQEELRTHIEQLLQAVVGALAHPSTQGSEVRVAEESTVFPRTGQSGTGFIHLTGQLQTLRLIIMEQWVASLNHQLSPADFEDLTQFNRELDKALALSIEQYAHKKQKQGRLFEAMLAALPDPCFILNLDGEFIYANQTMSDICNIPPVDILGKRFADMRLPAHYNGRMQLRNVIDKRESRSGEVEIGVSSGEIRCFEYYFAPVIDDNDELEAVAGIAHDVTARKETEDEIWRHANYDMLTNVPNRRLFLDRLSLHTSHSERTGDPFALCFIDLDHFKAINDDLGHEAGDELLRMAAERINACVRHSDTVARFAGDEFTVILLDTDDLELVGGIANKIQLALEEPFQLEQNEVNVSGSIGITFFPKDANSAKQLLNNADQAMYLAKHHGRNQVCFFTEVQQHAQSPRQRLINELRDAPQSHQLRLHYQPIINLANGRIAKAEALLRWQHPTRGLLLPHEFLGLAEEAGLMASLENWVFAEAASYSDQWADLTGSDESFQLTINASPLQFMHTGNNRPWQPHMETFARSGTRIAVELTENVFMHDSQNLSKRFAELQNAGIQLVLDDFGAGYSSLAYLKRFDVNYLKIDQSFVRDNSPESSSRTIAETIIVMAHKLGLKVVAEGVETEEQRDWLRRVQCDYAQGFYFSRPLPLPAFGQMLMGGATLH